MRLLCSKQKGPHIETAIKIAEIFIQGATSNGLLLYGSSSNNKLKPINVRINCVARAATSALRTTPINSLLAETGLRTIQSRYIKQGAQMYIKTILDEKHPNHQLGWEYTFNAPKKTQAAISYLVSIVSKRNLPLPKLFPFSLPTDYSYPPPWTNGQQNIHYKLAKLKKVNTSNCIYRSLFLELLATIELHCDGSLKDGMGTFAVVICQEQHPPTVLKQALMPPGASIYDCELAAIHWALEYSKTLDKTCLIVTDSLSSLQGLTNNPNSPSSNRAALRILSSCPQKTHITWIPSHIGILGNEAADLAAKEALKLPLIMEERNLQRCPKNPEKNATNRER